MRRGWSNAGGHQGFVACREAERGRSTMAGLAALLLIFVVGCSGGGISSGDAESCMTCHNGSDENDYGGLGIENPHPFGAADNLKCTTCHGGNPAADNVLEAHVPPPPEIGNEANLAVDNHAYFNRLTLTGIDRFEDYEVNGRTYTALEYLQFINPGDLRVVTQGESCGACHQGHAECVGNSLLATSAGIFSGATYAAGMDNQIPEHDGLYVDTAADLSFRAVSNPDYESSSAELGEVGHLLEYPVFSVLNAPGDDQIHKNFDYDSDLLPLDLNGDNSVELDSNLARLYHEQVAFTCGDCHLGSAGANNRYGDFRSSGCTSCHMQYSLSGRSGSRDPNVDKLEPLDPDQIKAPERSHVRAHRINSIAKDLPNGMKQLGIDDYACAGCHQGSNRTVMQYWGIRLDQNDDVNDHDQYPNNPKGGFLTTKNDERLFDPVVDNDTFNGRRHNQYLLFEDYDGDGRDDTPPDVHYDAGMGCIDCHGSFDLHGGDVTKGEGGRILSRMEQGVAIRCEDCHGDIDAYAPVALGQTYGGEEAMIGEDSAGNPLRHVVLEEDGNYYMYSRLTGKKHYLPQTKDTVHDNGKRDPFTDELVFSEAASFAMGRNDGDPSTGTGPLQGWEIASGFSHGENVSCAACHSSWTNSCIGCHLGGEYDTNNNFSNITGDRIAFEQANADFVYQSPVPFQLGIGPDNKVHPISPNTDVFWQYEDINNTDSQVFAFSDRNGGGNNTPPPVLPSLAHNVMMPHSIRGKVDMANEGPRYCAACHFTEPTLEAFRPQFDTLKNAMESTDFSALDKTFFEEYLVKHIGENPGNQINSPLWVHMAAGLGSGLFLFDEHGCAVNPIDEDDNRVGCDGSAPADTFLTEGWTKVRFNLDRIVEANGVSNGSNNHPMHDMGASPNNRDGSLDSGLSGPLGETMLRRLADPDLGIVLDTWYDADGVLNVPPAETEKPADPGGSGGGEPAGTK